MYVRCYSKVPASYPRGTVAATKLDVSRTNCALFSEYLAGLCNRRAVLDPSSVPSINYSVPPSSSPIEIYRGLRNDVVKGDRDSAKVAANKAGILRGVEAKRAAGSISEENAAEIASIVDASDISGFPTLVLYHSISPGTQLDRAGRH